jgi:hypothetical protein
MLGICTSSFFYERYPSPLPFHFKWEAGVLPGVEPPICSLCLKHTCCIGCDPCPAFFVVVFTILTQVARDRPMPTLVVDVIRQSSPLFFFLSSFIDFARTLIYLGGETTI